MVSITQIEKFSHYNYYLLKGPKLIERLIVLVFIVTKCLSAKAPTCNLSDENNRFDCHPDNGANENDCLKRGC